MRICDCLVSGVLVLDTGVHSPGTFHDLPRLSTKWYSRRYNSLVSLGKAMMAAEMD